MFVTCERRLRERTKSLSAQLYILQVGARARAPRRSFLTLSLVFVNANLTVSLTRRRRGGGGAVQLWTLSSPTPMSPPVADLIPTFEATNPRHTRANTVRACVKHGRRFTHTVLLDVSPSTSRGFGDEARRLAFENLKKPKTKNQKTKTKTKSLGAVCVHHDGRRRDPIRRLLVHLARRVRLQEPRLPHERVPRLERRPTLQRVPAAVDH